MTTDASRGDISYICAHITSSECIYLFQVLQLCDASESERAFHSFLCLDSISITAQMYDQLNTKSLQIALKVARL